MIPFDFDYYMPSLLPEAVMLYRKLIHQGKRPAIYSGGTEIITMGRLNIEKPGAVIDIKAIPECNIMEFQEEQLVLGSALTLTTIEEANLFPLLTKTASQIADHTARNKITLGGNICGKIYYREAVLPFLLAETTAALAGPHGYRTVPLNQIFNKQLQMHEGEFLYQMITPKKFLSAPHQTVKKRRQWKTGYPLATIAMLVDNQKIRAAFSGVCPFPFRLLEIEYELNKRNVPAEERIENAIKKLPRPILDDTEGSSDYRIFVLKNTLLDMVGKLEGKGG
ncbi:FAD binding domain-containing protein [Heyndrickxia acidicola]|uniref:FAD binding domain-containing protein n=1 Tax=Heyndrickxia acidicola TaxID=209389 RepID=A0ABU6MAB5_9BACI|nr:FAD binding domain-containing protein [Heyndrickxia acidicola]MED1201597.1 FAD binding domain-containing protein [Heyndrickxia acidicola]